MTILLVYTCKTGGNPSAPHIVRWLFGHAILFTAGLYIVTFNPQSAI